MASCSGRAFAPESGTWNLWRFFAAECPVAGGDDLSAEALAVLLPILLLACVHGANDHNIKRTTRADTIVCRQPTDEEPKADAELPIYCFVPPSQIDAATASVTVCSVVNGPDCTPTAISPLMP